MGLKKYFNQKLLRTPNQIIGALSAMKGTGNRYTVFTQTNGTSTQTPSIENISESATSPTSEQSQQSLFPTMTSSVADFLAKVSLLLEKDGDLTTPEELFSLTSLGFSKRNNHDCVYWKTSKDCCLMTREELLKPSSPRLMSWGMTSNGKYLTQRISGFHRTGSASSLPDILEEHVDQKYFLSQQTAKKMMILTHRLRHQKTKLLVRLQSITPKI